MGLVIYLPVNSDVCICSVININNYRFSFSGIYSWSWKLPVYRQDGLLGAKPCVWSLSQLQKQEVSFKIMKLYCQKVEYQRLLRKEKKLNLIYYILQYVHYRIPDMISRQAIILTTYLQRRSIASVDSTMPRRRNPMRCKMKIFIFNHSNTSQLYSIIVSCAVH